MSKSRKNAKRQRPEPVSIACRYVFCPLPPTLEQLVAVYEPKTLKQRFNLAAKAAGFSRRFSYRVNYFSAEVLYSYARDFNVNPAWLAWGLKPIRNVDFSKDWQR